MMKVLMITSCLDAGGAEKWCYDTLLNMDRCGLTIDYYYYEDVKIDQFIEGYKKAGINLYFRELNKRKGGALFHLRKDLNKFIAVHGPYDAVHINGLKLIYISIILDVAYKNNIPVRITHSHNSLSSYTGGISSLVKKVIRKNIINKATVLGACSLNAGVAKYGDDIVKNPKFKIIKNGVRLDRLGFDDLARKRTREELGVGNNFTCLFLGRLSAQKNPRFAIDVFNGIHKLDESVCFVVVGSGDLETEILDQIGELGLSECVRHVPWTDKPSNYLNAADLLVLPSIYEGFPFVTIEAQCSGIPSLVSEAIPTDVDLTGLIYHLKLSDGPEKWAQKALEFKNYERHSRVDSVKTNGYDIIDTSAAFRKMLEGYKYE